MARKDFRVKEKELRWRCNLSWLPADQTDQIEPLDEIIGQQRALEAIQAGLGIRSHGYNIYVAGLTGTGKMTTIEKLLKQIDSRNEIPGDICYVYNFSNPSSPLAVTLQKGEGKQLAKDMEQMIRELAQLIPGIEKNEQFQEEKKHLLERFKTKNERLLKEFEKEVREDGLALVQIEIGGVQRPEIFPVYEEKIITWEQLNELVENRVLREEDVAELIRKHDEYMERLDAIFQAIQSLESQLLDGVKRLRLRFVRPTLQHWLRSLKKKYPSSKLHQYFDQVARHITEHLENFVPAEGRKRGASAESPSNSGEEADPFRIYRVNVLVDNSDLERPPIIIEQAPTFANLFGTIEHSLEKGGVWETDFLRIKAGSILQANGGYLVFNFLDAVQDPRVWPALKRVLKNNQLLIQAESLPFGASPKALKPEPIPIDLKVIVIGDYFTYQFLFENDDEFRKIFKIRADFDTEMPNTKSAIQNYARFMSKICKDEGLLPLNREAMALVVEEGVRIAGRKNRLSTRFSDIADILRESHYWAMRDGGKLISADSVRKALQAKRERLNLTEEKLQNLILDQVLLIDTDGAKVGQVNGISLYDLGDYSFGKPSRITAEVGIGHAGIINIEREAELGGKIYNKGVLIISGYLNGKYAQEHPLTMNASLCFEQSYSGVDGDSASAAEIFALLSRLAEVPLRQDLAVTGSVNQKGEIQPIGGVNEKIEGVYQVCKARGFTGNQGVIIPKNNVPDLMLSEELLESVRKKEFSIFAIATIDEGLELLTGMKAGKADKNGNFPPNTIHGRVQRRLRAFAEKIKEFDLGGDEK